MDPSESAQHESTSQAAESKTPSSVSNPEETTSKSSSGSKGLGNVGIVGGATILSRILGLIRDMVFVSLFSRVATDAFAVAFTIPNMLRRLLAEGIISTAFIPVFTSLEQKSKEEQEKTYGAVLGSFFAVLLVVTAAGMFLSPWLAKMFAPGFTDDRLALASYLLGLMFPFLFLVGLASFWVAILNTKKHFAAPALGPVMLNIGIISCAFLLSHFFKGDRAIAAMGIGVLAGGVLQLLLQVFTLTKLNVRIRPTWNPTHPVNREIMLLMAPTLLGLGVYQINMMVSRQLASFLAKGSVTYLYISDRLMELPLGVIAVAFATVNLPTLSRQADAQDWPEFRTTIISGIRNVLFFCVPAALGLLALRRPVIALLFERNKFTYEQVLLCAHIFIPATLGLIFIAILRNLTPSFYAYRDTKTPVKIAFVSLLVNAALSGLFAFLLGMQAQGLTLANACSAIVAVVLSFMLLNKRLNFKASEFSFIWELFPKLLAAGGVMAGLLILGESMVDWKTLNTLWRAALLGGMIAVGSGVYFVLIWKLKVKEGQFFFQKLGRVAGKFKR